VHHVANVVCIRNLFRPRRESLTNTCALPVRPPGTHLVPIDEYWQACHSIEIGPAEKPRPFR
jgi:hypothetical protein